MRRPLDPIAAAYAACGLLFMLLALPLLASGDEGWRWLAAVGAALIMIAALIQRALARRRVRL